MKSSRGCGGFCLVTVLLAANFAQGAGDPDPAAEPSKSAFMQFLEQDYLFGTWGGRRTWLKEHGVDMEVVYFGAWPRNMSGGIKAGQVYEGAIMGLLDLDSEKLLNYGGGHLHIGGLWIHNGPAFSKNFVGDLNQVSLLDFPDSLRLWELWYEQKFWEGKISVKLGQMAIDQDFITAEYYLSLASLNFLNQTFFFPTVAFNVYDPPIDGFPIGHHALASTPYGAPGARVRFSPTEHCYVQAGVYDGNPDRSYSGTRINLNEREGALAYFEAGYRLNGAKEDTGLPGNYKIGAYYHTDDFFDFYSTLTAPISGQPPDVHSGNYGYYFLADQMLYRENPPDEDPAGQGLAGFFRIAGAPSDRNLAPLGIDGGLVYKGLIPGRDWDTFGVAGSYLEMSDDITRAQRDINAVIPGAAGVPVDYEAVLEVSYRAQLTAWWTLQPDFQWVMHPGGSSALDDAFVFSLFTTLRF
jgi:porin